MFSAEWGSYLAAPHQNWLWGWTAWGYSGNERHLFPGVAAVDPRRARPRVAAAAAGVDLSRRSRCWRSSSRSASTASSTAGSTITCSRSADSARRRASRSSPAARCRCSPASASSASSASSPAPARAEAAARDRAGRDRRRIGLVAARARRAVDRRCRRSISSCRRAPPSVIVEFPMGDYDPTYMFWSTYHWHSLVNGYSGYTPADIVETMTLMETFPDDESVARLQQLDVRYVLSTRRSTSRRSTPTLMEQLSRRPELIPSGRYRDWVGGDTQIFELRYADGAAPSPRLRP